MLKHPNSDCEDKCVRKHFAIFGTLNRSSCSLKASASSCRWRVQLNNLAHLFKLIMTYHLHECCQLRYRHCGIELEVAETQITMVTDQMGVGDLYLLITGRINCGSISAMNTLH